MGTATIPQAYLPFNGAYDTSPGGPLGAYMSGSSGMADASAGTYWDDSTGY
jgi:hypothetical protein